MSVYLERAQELRASVEPHYNCAQSVLVPFAESTGMSCEQACALAQGFGGGMQTGNACGAYTGAVMALGVLGLASHENVVALTERLRERNDGVLMCADLLQANAQAGGEKKPFCDALVYNSVELVEELLTAAQ
ncbi:MAG: C-GCAxxG-C-C family protein [Coriobacteriales bacterium]|nr:C-GCAxxG-C-C family protein [Coriobacteriales bacterium]